MYLFQDPFVFISRVKTSHIYTVRICGESILLLYYIVILNIKQICFIGGFLQNTLFKDVINIHITTLGTLYMGWHLQTTGAHQSINVAETAPSACRIWLSVTASTTARTTSTRTNTVAVRNYCLSTVY